MIGPPAARITIYYSRFASFLPCLFEGFVDLGPLLAFVLFDWLTVLCEGASG